ncbi:hypothetical protein [Pacificoceanicola onchidii]|uniref:hypothetical protein n=1 Tax=Pacificoceanicola onchidii TaxID=2562685 RepID=UPI0010A32584|nr:hypothetical protein [Pacificoceanicola onchidii]
MRLVFPLILAVFASQSTDAQEILGWPTDKTPSGTKLIYELSDGSTRVREVSYDNSGNPVLKVSTDIEENYNDNKVSHTIFADIMGNVTSLEYQPGRYETYTPHNCSRVLGHCEYTFTNIKGREFKRVTESQIQGDWLIEIVKSESGTELWTTRRQFSKDGFLQRLEHFGSYDDSRFEMTLKKVVRPYAIEPSERKP